MRQKALCPQLAQAEAGSNDRVRYLRSAGQHGRSLVARMGQDASRGRSTYTGTAKPEDCESRSRVPSSKIAGLFGDPQQVSATPAGRSRAHPATYTAAALCFKVQTGRALVALILWARRVMAGKEATLAQQAASQLCRRQRVQQPHRAYRDRRIFNALDDPLGGADLLAVETNDEAGEYYNTGTIYFVDALRQAAPRILLLSHRYQGVSIRALNSNEDPEKICRCQGA